jgi:hypothetical protein
VRAHNFDRSFVKLGSRRRGGRCEEAARKGVSGWKRHGTRKPTRLACKEPRRAEGEHRLES